MGGIYEVCRRWIKCHDIHTKFHENWFRNSKVDRRGSYKLTVAKWAKNENMKVFVVFIN
jgi:hypothetical protein